MMPPRPPRNEKKGFRIRLSPDTEPFLFIPRTSDVPRFQTGTTQRVFQKTRLDPQGCSQIKYTERIIAQCNKIIRGSPRAAKERFKRRREGTAGKLPTGREHPRRRNPHPPRLRKSLKERGWVRAALAGLGRRKGNAGVFPPSSESFPSPSPIFSFTAQASAAAGWGNACPRGERGRVRRRWSRRATPRPSAAG